LHLNMRDEIPSQNEKLLTVTEGQQAYTPNVANTGLPYMKYITAPNYCFVVGVVTYYS